MNRIRYTTRTSLILERTIMQIAAQRKPNMTDSELIEFLKKIKIKTEKGCWITNYYKNSKRQARLYYKNKYIFLYRLSHLLFNSNMSNLTSIFRKCNNFICFNPTHLTDNLKEKQFKLLMSNNELFEGCPTKEDKKKILIDYGNWLSKELGRPLIQSDFEVAGRIFYITIIKYFGGSIINYFNRCDFPSAQRKSNMADSDLKEYLELIKIKTERGCWITDQYKTSYPDGRIRIIYKRKLHYLYRVSYTLFNDNIPDKLIIMHKCDNPPCFNPKHLILGNNQDNMRDAANKGRLGSTSKQRKRHKITDPYDYESLLNFIKQHIEITEKDEWLFATAPSQEYPIIKINKKKYRLHRLLLANKLGKTYDEIAVACHRLSDGSKPNKHDVNPAHLFEGTHSENMLDTIKYHKKYKLDMNKANKVKNAAAKSDFSKRGSTKSFDMQWAARLNVSRSCVTSIRLGKSWKK